MVKQLEQQLLDLQLRNDEQARQLTELQAYKNRTEVETHDLNRSVL